MRDPLNPCLLATASRSPKTVNQDSGAAFHHPYLPLACLLAADGIGSFYGAEYAASAAVQSLRRQIESLASCQHVARWLPSFFRKAKMELQESVSALSGLPADLNRNAAFGTTLIAAVDTPDEIIVAYTGNGAVWHIRGNFNTFPKSQYLPWSALNYLNPHTVPEDGRNQLYKMIAIAGNGQEAEPSLIQIRKDNHLFGDILMICTDGISSFDQTPIGKDGADQVWISGELPLQLFYARLNQYFDEGSRRDAGLAACLDAYLVELQKKNLMADDCTIAVLISGQAYSYQTARRGEKR